MTKLDDWLEDFERLWRRGDRPDWRVYLQRETFESDEWTSVFCDLVALDLEYRWRLPGDSQSASSTESSGDPSLFPIHPLLEDYVAECSKPVSQADLPIELIAEEYRIRHRWGDRPKTAEYVRRFGDTPELRTSLRDVQNELVVDRVSSETLSLSGDGLTTEVDSVTFGQPISVPIPFGRYRLLRRLGRGGMGQVWLAEDTQLDRRVALKLPRLDDASLPLRERFINEAKAAAVLRHPHICPVFDAGEIDGQPFLTMAYIEGVTLDEQWQAGEQQSLVASLTILAKVARAMQIAHDQGIVHRDLKPSNVMIEAHGEPVVMDFGLAYRTTLPDGERLTRSGDLFGSPAYMSPEQVEGRKDINSATDIYSLGVMLYEAIAGRIPFQGTVGRILTAIARDEPPRLLELRADVDPELERLCLQMLDKEPSLRPNSMNEVAERLDSIRQRLTDAPLERVPEVEQRILARRRLMVASVLFVVLLAGILLQIRTPHGTVTIDVSPEFAKDVKVHVLQGGGLIEVADSVSGWSLSLREGEYSFELCEGSEELVIEPRQVRISRDRQKIVSVTMAQPVPEGPASQPTTNPLPDSTDWIDLLAGGNLSQWQSMTSSGEQWEIQQESEGGWEIRDAVLVCTTGEHGWLKLKQPHHDFELDLEFRLPRDGNSGVIFRSSGSGRLDQTGLEAQIIDDNWSRDKLFPGMRCGALYRITGPELSASKPAGEWNRMRVRCEGDRIRIELNGVETAAHQLAPRDAAKLTGHGVIGLWNWNGDAQGTAFRNLRLRPLNARLVAKHALRFDGRSNHVRISNAPFDGRAPLTIEAWVRPRRDDARWRGFSTGYVMSAGHAQHPNQLAVYQAGKADPFAAVFRASGPRTGTSRDKNHATSFLVPKYDVWSHVAVVWSDDHVRFYWNGVLRDDMDVGTSVMDRWSDIRLGHIASTGPIGYCGDMREVRISTTARYKEDFTPAQRFEPDDQTFALYHFDEGEGDVLHDSSANGFHGKIIGATWIAAPQEPEKE